MTPVPGSAASGTMTSIGTSQPIQRGPSRWRGAQITTDPPFSSARVHPSSSVQY